MTRSRTARIAAAALALAGTLACAASAPNSEDVRGCVGLVAPRAIAVASVPLPATFATAQVGAEIPAEVTVGRNGAVSDAKVGTSEFALLAPFAEETLKRSRFSPGSLEGNPVAVRVSARVQIGAAHERKGDPQSPALWAYVPGGDSREARWQLRDSVTRLTLAGHVGRVGPPGAAITAFAPTGAQAILLMLPASESPRDFHQTVQTKKFFARPGDYRLEVRSGADALASARITIAEDYTQAIVNACDPVAIVKKARPGN